jgi:hypothetical protein
MRVVTISLERLKNLGNYENEKVGMTIDLAEGDDPQKAIDWARKQVEQSLDLDTDSLTEDTLAVHDHSGN